MATSLWSEFYPLVAPSVIGCPSFTMDIALRDAAIEFFREARTWRMELDSDTLTIGDPLYKPALSSSVAVEIVGKLRVGGEDLDPAVISMLGDDWQTDTGTPKQYFMADETTIRLVPIPDAALTVTGWLTLRPSLTATGIDTSQYQVHRNAIVAGALAILKAIPGKAWSNPGDSKDKREAFEEAISKASSRDRRGVMPRSKPVFC